MLTTTKRYYLLVLVIALFAFNHIACAQTVTEKDIYDYYNNTHSTLVNNRMILEKRADEKWIAKALKNKELFDKKILGKNAFTQADTLFMRKELSQFRNFKWSAKQLKTVLVEDSIRPDEDMHWDKEWDTLKLKRPIPDSKMANLEIDLDLNWDSLNRTKSITDYEDSLSRWEGLRNMCKDHLHHKCNSSIPLFSADKQKCIIYRSGTIYIYKKDNDTGRWGLLDSFN